jgi:hypothetical protein
MRSRWLIHRWQYGGGNALTVHCSAGNACVRYLVYATGQLFGLDH